jgi:hypothetical protein
MRLSHSLSSLFLFITPATLSLAAPGSEVTSPLEMGKSRQLPPPSSVHEHEDMASKTGLQMADGVPLKSRTSSFCTSSSPPDGVRLDQPLPPRKRIKILQSPQTAETPVLHGRRMAGSPTSPLALHSLSAAHPCPSEVSHSSI